MADLKEFLEKKDVTLSAHRYGIEAMSAMAQGLFASLLIGTIIETLGTQLGIQFLVDAGTFAKSVAGPAMAVSIGYALKAPQLVLFSLIASLPIIMWLNETSVIVPLILRKPKGSASFPFCSNRSTAPR